MSDWNSYNAIEEVLYRGTVTCQESQALYSKWAQAGTYDKVMNIGGAHEYDGLQKFHNAIRDLQLDIENVRVLDIGAGTGLTGELLRKIGFKTVDAIEPNQEFVKILEKKKLYDNMIVDFIGGDHQIDIPDDTYDLIAMCGVFAPGHLPCSAITEITRITKPGGYVVNCMREEYLWTVPEYKGCLELIFDQHVREGHWKRITREVYPNHYHKMNGVLSIFQVC